MNFLTRTACFGEAIHLNKPAKAILDKCKDIATHQLNWIHLLPSWATDIEGMLNNGLHPWYRGKGAPPCWKWRYPESSKRGRESWIPIEDVVLNDVERNIAMNVNKYIMQNYEQNNFMVPSGDAQGERRMTKKDIPDVTYDRMAYDAFIVCFGEQAVEGGVSWANYKTTRQGDILPQYANRIQLLNRMFGKHKTVSQSLTESDRLELFSAIQAEAAKEACPALASGISAAAGIGEETAGPSFLPKDRQKGKTKGQPKPTGQEVKKRPHQMTEEEKKKEEEERRIRRSQSLATRFTKRAQQGGLVAAYGYGGAKMLENAPGADAMDLNVVYDITAELVGISLDPVFFIVFITLISIVFGTWWMFSRRTIPFTSLPLVCVEGIDPASLVEAASDISVAATSSKGSKEVADEDTEIPYYIIYVSPKDEAKRVHVEGKCLRPGWIPGKLPVMMVDRGVTVEWCRQCAGTERKRARAIRYFNKKTF